MKAIPLFVLLTLYSAGCVAQETVQSDANDGPLTVTLSHEGSDMRHSSRQRGVFSCDNFNTEIEFGYVRGGGDSVSRISINGVDLDSGKRAEINSTLYKPMESLVGFMLIDCPDQTEEVGLYLWAYVRRLAKNTPVIERHLIKVTKTGLEFQDKTQFVRSRTNPVD